MSRLWPSRRFAAASFFLVPALLLTLSSCDNSEPAPDLIIAGVNYTQLFAPPTASEIQTIEAAWAARSNPARDARIVAETTLDGARVAVIAHTQTGTDGVDFTHYGVVRIPASTANLPVLVVHHGGDNGFSVDGTDPNGQLTAMVAAYPMLFASTVQVLPVYRSETIVTPASLAGPYTAGGTPSPWDYDVDDAIGLLNAALELFPDAMDNSHIGALGFSRGSDVALLMAVRDARIQAVTEYYGPVDFFDDSIQTLATGLYFGLDGVDRLPGAVYLRDEVLLPLQAGDLSYADARLEVTRRSAARFSSRLPSLQVHHHEQDPTVPYAQSVALNAAIQSTPNHGVYEFNSYANALPAGVQSRHNPLAMPASLMDTEAFLIAQLANSTRVPALAF